VDNAISFLAPLGAPVLLPFTSIPAGSNGSQQWGFYLLDFGGGPADDLLRLSTSRVGSTQVPAVIWQGIADSANAKSVSAFPADGTYQSWRLVLAPVPESGTFALSGFAVAAVIVWRSRRKRRA